MVLLIAAVGATGYLLLARINRYLAQAEGPARFVLLPSSAIWGFLPGFSSLVLAWDLLLFIWSRLGDAENAQQYAEWT